MAQLDLSELYRRAQEDTLLDLLMADEITPIQGFLLKRVKQTALGCWEWQGGMHHSGYGCFKQGGRFAYSHRASFEAFKGPATGLFICHACDNRRCCYPGHLFLGTHQDNMDDMKAKGRGRNQNS